MIIAAIITGFILLFFACLTYYIDKRKDGKFDDGLTLGMINATLLCIEIIFIYFTNNDLQPTTMDVYQGKTTLEYKVVNDVKVDSVVIFNNDDATNLNIY